MAEGSGGERRGAKGGGCLVGENGIRFLAKMVLKKRREMLLLLC